MNRQKNEKFRIAFNFMTKIPLETNRTKKVHLKIAFKFYERNRFQIYSEQNKIISEILPYKYPTTTVKMGTIFEKSWRSIVIWKIIVPTPILNQNFKHKKFVGAIAL